MKAMFAFHSPSHSLHPFPAIPVRKIRVPIFYVRTASSTSSTTESDSNNRIEASNDRRRLNYEGFRLEETVDGKARLDSWISSRILGVSRARVQSSIRSGLVSVNGRVVDKVSYAVRAGDRVNCVISELQPLRAEPEDISLDITYEDEHLLVVNKPPDMVVHLAPGNPNGTLVNAILHHCSIPSVAFPDIDSFSEKRDTSDDDDNDNDDNVGLVSASPALLGEMSSSSSVRPGIVHRLDKGTSGLLVVAKNELSHADLSEQFKLRTIERVYISLTTGIPSPISGRVAIPIGRDLHNRVRMVAATGGNHSGRARHAASRYKVVEVLAGGGSALVEWRLETGRTHQIRVHAKYMGIPLLGDEVYGGTKNMALSLLQQRTHRSHHAQLVNLVSCIERPCLHAMVLGFKHPFTGELMRFTCPPPADFSKIWSQLRELSHIKGE